MEINEKKLIQECQNNQTSSFAPLYDRYIKKIYSFIYYRVSNKEVAEDITSQTFLKAVRAIHNFDTEKGMFSAWLYRIAKNNIIDYYRTKTNDLDIDSIWNLSDNSDMISESSRKIELSLIKKYLSKLESEQREVIILRVWDELSYKEIAEIVGKSSDNCKMIFSRSLSKLRKEIPISLLILLLLKL